MISNIYSLIGLILSTLLILFLFAFINKQKKQTYIKKSFQYILFCLLIWCTGLLAQITLSERLGISPIYFDFFVYIGICFVAIAFLVMSIIFVKPNLKININLLVALLSIIPIFCLIALWTNDIHHMFYVEYSIFLSKGVYGPFFYITSVYTYLLLGISLIFLASYSIKNIRFYFLQSIFIFLGALIPVIINLFGLLGVFDLSIYITPICFSVTILCFALSIFKFGFLKLTPIALKNIVNRISDSYLVLNSDLIIVDFNETLLKTFKVTRNSIINNKIFEINGTFTNFNNIATKLKAAVKKTNSKDYTVVLKEYFNTIDKYFNIEITRITEGDNLLGTLILLKDITQHTKDMQTIKSNQDILIEKERLASLGQMIGRYCS